MQSSPSLLVAGIFAYVLVRLAGRLESVACKQLKWWQKLLRVTALILVVLIASNPELWGLGLLGDTVFLDLFVLLMGIQLQMMIFWALEWSGKVILRGWRWLIAPNPLLLHMWAAWIVAGILTMGIAWWKAVQRMAAKYGSKTIESNLWA
jgi:hypothetical protein